MDIDRFDEREFAWLLVRSDTLTGDFIKLWQMVPVRPGSFLSAVVGYPLRFLTLLGTLLLTGLIMLAMLIAAAQVPVTIFAYVHPFFPAWVWWTLLGTTGISLAGYLVFMVGSWLQAATLEEELPGGEESNSEEDGLAPQGEGSEAGDAARRPGVMHESARNSLFAGLSIGIGVVLQCTAVVAGPACFDGPLATGWQWPLLFGEQLFNTMLLGIPAGFLPRIAAIGPATPLGQALMTGVDLFYVAGVIAMAMLILSSAFKIRELFNGTTRDLADHLEALDISGPQRLMIHRVAVLRPLDKREVVSLTKEAFLHSVKDQAAPGPNPE